jgi:hypothetical protein
LIGLSASSEFAFVQTSLLVEQYLIFHEKFGG